MRHRYLEIASTPAVVEARQRIDGQDRYAMDPEGELMRDRLDMAAAAFIAARDSFYLASVNEAGWPYVQHRGGPRGFLRVLDERTLGFADFRGNRQYLTVGNTSRDPRVSLFLMDYARQRRLKLFGTLEVSDEPAFLEAVRMPEYPAVVERGIRIHVAAYDWNCPQHITRRFTEEEVAAMMVPLQERVRALEQELARRPAAS